MRVIKADSALPPFWMDLVMGNEYVQDLVMQGAWVPHLIGPQGVLEVEEVLHHEGSRTVQTLVEEAQMVQI